MAAKRRFILFELNEVPLRVVRHYAHNQPGSAFAKMLEAGRHWTTVTPDEGHLSPWVTWPTLHRGVPSNRHHIIALGQDVGDMDRTYPPVWQLLAKAGRRVGLFGSLHSYPPPKNAAQYAFYLPDTFAAGPEASPPELSEFQSFNLHMVAGSGRNVSARLPLKQAIRFLLRAGRNGIGLGTYAKIARQLAAERIWRHRTARRRTVQSLLAFDLFYAQLQAKRPDASFFFTNHVASSLHRYWPATFTTDYTATSWARRWVRRFSREIDYAMGEADQMLARLMDFADRNPDYVILVAGSMGQAAVDSPERQIKTEVLLRDLTKFLDQLGATERCTRRPTMEPTYTLAFDEPGGADAFMAAIATAKIAGEPVSCTRLSAKGVEFVLGFPNVPDDALSVTIGNRAIDPAAAGIANVTIDDEVGAAAYHVPEGMLLVYDPVHQRGGRGDGDAARPMVRTTSIAPTLLALQGIDPPPYMEPPLHELLDGRKTCPQPAEALV